MEMWTFEQLPQAVGQLYDKLPHIEQLLLEKSQPQPELDEQMTVGQAASFLNLSVSTVYGKVCRAEIPVNKRGKRLYFYKSELAAWIREGRRKTRDEIRREVELFPSRKNR
jgi:excisionase family DNA binding protein